MRLMRKCHVDKTWHKKPHRPVQLSSRGHGTTMQYLTCVGGAKIEDHTAATPPRRSPKACECWAASWRC
eukprot:5251219-Pyramimonas_sp.AAC.1